MPTELMLPAREQKRLDKCEERIAKGMIGAFYEVGTALAEINESGLYQHYGTFAGYVDERWGMSVRNAQRLIAATSVMDQLRSKPDCDQLVALPTQESQVRHLAKVDPADLPAVWEKVVEKAPKTEDKKPIITEKLVKDVVEWWLAPDDDGPIDTTAEEVEPEEPEVEYETCPDCGGDKFYDDGTCAACTDPDEEQAEQPAKQAESHHFAKFLEVWNAADELGKCLIRNFVAEN